MNTIQELARPLFELSLAVGVRNRLAVDRGRRDGRGTLAAARNRHHVVLREDDVKATQSRELFILGSGPSALDITPAFRARMRAGTTIGLNSWVLHDFIPDIYGLEQMENDHYIPVAEGLSEALNRKEVFEAQPLVLHLRPHHSTSANRLVEIPEALRARVRYYGRFTAETRRITNLVPDLTDLLRRSLRHEIPHYVLLDSGLSVARMIHLGILSRFDSIILVGVDLNSTDYFFEQDPSFLERHKLRNYNPWMSRSDSHDTEERKNRHFTASEFIPALARASTLVGGPQVYVASEKSRLSDHLPLIIQKT